MIGHQVLKAIVVTSTRIAAGALAGSGAAALLGVLYGMLDGLCHRDWELVLPPARYFALCGAIAGAVTVAFYSLIDPVGITDEIDMRAGAPVRRDAGRGDRKTAGCLRLLNSPVSPATRLNGRMTS